MAVADPDPLPGLAHFSTAGMTAVHERTGVHHVTAPAASWLHIPAVVVAVAVAYRAGYCVVRDAWVARRRRLRHAGALALVARPLPRRDALVLDQPTPLAYCVPGRRRTIVATDGAVRALSNGGAGRGPGARADSPGRSAPPRANPPWRVGQGVPAYPILRQASREVSRLLEMCADDTAVRRHGRAAITGALRAAVVCRDLFAASSTG